MVILLLLHDVADLGQSLDGFVSHLLPRVVEHFVQQGEQGTHCLVVALLTTLLSDEGDQGDELIQQGTLDILVGFFRKEFQVRQKTFG